MQDIVIIPTYDRPEMLWFCLEHLAKSPESQSVQIRVYVDAHVDQLPPRDEIETVLGKFPQLSLYLAYRQPHTFQGNSFNVLMAYKEAFESDAQHVFLVEDDVLIHPGFFIWHRLAHADRQLGCSIAVENPGHGAYSSIGVCFRRPMLKTILPHCRGAYFQNMRQYCHRVFPPSRFDCEQDGLFARLLKGHQIVWATVPYAQHVGWYGYHRKRSVRPYGSLNDRYAQVQHALASTEALRGWMRDFGDIRPLQTPCN